MARVSRREQLRRLAELPLLGAVAARAVRNVDRAEIDGMRELGGGMLWETLAVRGADCAPRDRGRAAIANPRGATPLLRDLRVRCDRPAGDFVRRGDEVAVESARSGSSA